MKRFYSLLILPLLAVFCLVGCGKTDRTVAEIKTLYTDTVNSYEAVIPAKPYEPNNNTNYSNWYFEGNLSTETGIVSNPKMYVIFDNQNGLNSAVKNDFGFLSSDSQANMNANLKLRYNQLTTVYARTLTMAFNYYSNWSESFYSNIDSKKPNKDDLTNLYEKLKAFQRELASFNTAKKNTEREITLFELDGALIASSIDKLNYNYNKLIQKTIDFVSYFKDLHVKYFYSDVTTIDGAYAKRVYDEGLLELANYIYYDYLNSLTKNATTQIYHLNGNEFDIFNYSGSHLKDIALINPSDNTAKNVKQINSTLINTLNETDHAKYEIAKGYVEQFEISLNTFKQYFKLYKKVYGKVSMEGFNNYRFSTNGGYNNLDAYMDALNDTVDQANARVLLDFEQNKIYAFLNSTYSFVNKTIV